jgi:two-component system, NarL family, nitrate/nitrite response regulator NarL
VGSILILSTRPVLADNWKAALSSAHDVFVVTHAENVPELARNHNAAMIIIDAEHQTLDQAPLSQLKNSGLKTLILGNNWSEDEQINALVTGVSGYCESEAANTLLLRATNSILQGDIWIQRHLVPKVIGTLVNLNNARTVQVEKKHSIEKNLQSLTNRELDVAKMVQTGESNKMIANLLNISERTVKAHLTSIFQKLDVRDRLHLAILLKEIS